MRSPLSKITDLEDGLLAKVVHQDSILVRRPDKVKRLAIGTLVTFVVVMAGLTTRPFLPLWLYLVDLMIISLAAGAGISWFLARAMSYRSGWLDGRQEMMTALSETLGRGMALDDWIEGEAQKDAVVLGLPPDAFKRENGG